MSRPSTCTAGRRLEKVGSLMVDQKFCGECGARLSEGFGFCGECGTRVGAAAARPPADPEPAAVLEPVPGPAEAMDDAGDAPTTTATTATPEVAPPPTPVPSPAAAQAVVVPPPVAPTTWSSTPEHTHPGAPATTSRAAGVRRWGLVLGHVGLVVVLAGGGLWNALVLKEYLDGYTWVTEFYTFGLGFRWGMGSWILLLMPAIALVGLLLGRRATPVLFAMLPLYAASHLFFRSGPHTQLSSYGIADLALITGSVVCLVAGVLNAVSAGEQRTAAAPASPAGTGYRQRPAPVAAGPVPPPHLGGPPALTLTIVITLLFGVFGVIPASRHSSLAQQMGYPGGRYWKAFWWSFAGSVAIGFLLTIAFYVALYAAVVSSSTY